MDGEAAAPGTVEDNGMNEGPGPGGTPSLNDIYMQVQHLKAQLENAPEPDQAFNQLLENLEMVEQPLEHLQARLRFDPAHMNWAEYFLRALDFPVHPGAALPNIEAIKERAQLLQLALIYLNMVHTLLGLSGDTNEQTLERQNTFTRLTMQTMSLRYSLSYINIMHSLSSGADLSFVPQSMSTVLGMSNPEACEKLKDHQQVLNYLYSICFRDRLKMHRGRLYRQVYTEEGIATHAWEFYKEVDEFVYEQTSRQMNNGIWVKRTSSTHTVEFVIKTMREGRDEQLPRVNPSRYLFSFRNGLYNIEEQRFYPWHDPAIQGHWAAHKYFNNNFDPEPPGRDYEHIPNFLQDVLANATFLDNATPAQQQTVEDMLARLQAGEQVDDGAYDEVIDILADMNLETLPLERHPLHIPTPSVDQILTYQDLPLNVQMWVWVFLGKMLYPLLEHDQWQAIMFLKGAAGTGKSTLIDVVQKFYQDDDVSVWTAKSEITFGMAGHYDKLAWVTNEFRNDFNLNQADFQSIVTGERVSVARKFQPALFVNWRVPGMIAGNQAGPYQDTGGSIARRMVIVEFMNLVSEEDHTLRGRIEREMPNIIKKADMMYRMITSQFNTQGIWNLLPSYFRRTRKNFRSEVSPPHAFMESGIVVCGPGLWMRYDDFHSRFLEYCKSKNLGRATFTREQREPLFKEYGLFFEENSMRPVNANLDMEQASFILNCCLTEHRPWQEQYLQQGQANQQ